MCGSFSQCVPPPSPSENACLPETNDNSVLILDTNQELMRRLTLTVGTRAVLPSDSLSVSDLLKLHLPTFSTTIPSMEPNEYFSNHTPTESITIYLSRPIPPVNFITGLRNVARQAMLDGKLSIMDWTCNDVTMFFSFELIEFWSSLVQIAKARQEWEAALRWLEQAAWDEPLDKEVHEIHLILQITPWKAELHILHSRLSFLEMATFLSNGWLSSSQIDMALSSIASRQLQICSSEEQCHYLIGSTVLSELLTSSPLLHNKKSPDTFVTPHIYNLCAPRDLQCAGAHLTRYQSLDANGEVVFIAYSPPSHWAAISITSEGVLEWADSLGRHTPSSLLTGVQTWLHYHLSLAATTWLSNSGVKASGSAVCSRPFMAHPRIWRSLVLHIFLQQHSSILYLPALLQEMVTISKSMRTSWIPYLGS
jgi:hypothetical protein